MRLSLLRIDSNVDIATGAECVGFAGESVVVKRYAVLIAGIELTADEH